MPHLIKKHYDDRFWYECSDCGTMNAFNDFHCQGCDKLFEGEVVDDTST